jgi:DNA ligase (NAD+)
MVADLVLGDRASVGDFLKTRSMDKRYEEDGCVMRIDDERVWLACGFTAHHPSGSIAWKHQTEPRWSTVKDVIWQVSRTGTITPVIEIAPIELSGVIVSRATLHHAGNFEKLRCRTKDRVKLSRRGGVIPHVELVERVHSQDGDAYVMPKKCPSCGSPAMRDGHFLRCSQPSACPDAVIGTMVYFARAMGYDGFGPGLATSAYIDGVMSKPHHLYDFLPSELEGVDGWGKANIAALKTGMPRSAPSWRLLQALGIDGFGKTQSARTLEHFGTLNALIAWAESTDEDPSIPGMGELMLWKLREGVAEAADELRALLEHIEIEDEVVVTGPLTGSSFVFTGRLTDMERSDAQAAVRALGASTPNGVTKTLTYLVVGDLANDKQISKRTKAAKYNASGANIKIIEEEAFVEILRKHTTL